jgi:hypothetical protein
VFAPLTQLAGILGTSTKKADMTRRMAGALFVMAGLVAPVAASPIGQDGSVKITAARANVRAEAKDTAPVLTQLTAGTDLVLKAIEGDWFRVQLPPDARLGGARVEAFVSKKVARLVTAPTTPEPAVVEPAVPEPRDAMSVAVKGAAATTWLAPEEARVRLTGAQADSLRALSGVLTAEDPPSPGGSAPLTFAWTVSGSTSSNLVTDRRPVFVVQFKSVPGFDAADLAPVIVRLVPAIAGVRIAAAVRAPADRPSRTVADWDVMRDWKQESVRVSVQSAEPGAAVIQPTSDLAPGEYAVVLRPSNNKKLAGPAVFEGRTFTTLWTFSVR